MMPNVDDVGHGRGIKYSDAVPIDLIAVGGTVAIAYGALFSPAIRGTPLAALLWLFLFLFAPGYAFLAILFPGGRPPDVDRFRSFVNRPVSLNARGLDGVERVALSFGMSLALLPLIGIAITVLAGGFTVVGVLDGVTAFVVVAGLLGAVRWMLQPPEARFAVPVERLVPWARQRVIGTSTASAVVNVALAVSVVLAVVAMSTAVIAPRSAEQFTDFYVLSANERGDYVTSGYPTTFVSGQGQSLVLGIDNHERRGTTYAVVVELQRVGPGGEVVESAELDRFRETVEAGETRLVRRTLAPGMVGDDLRLRFFLYRGEPPADADARTAYRYLQLWITVNDGATG